MNINRGLLNIYTHSVIFSKKYREEVLKYDYKTINCWDIFQNKFNLNKYYYNIPLSFQIIEETENSLNWQVFSILRSLHLNIAYYLNAHNDPTLIFYIWYILSYILLIINISIILLILYLINRWKKFI